MRAAKHFMRNGIGMPGPFVAAMGLLPMFRKFAANGLTLTFDYAALGDANMQGKPLRAEEWATVTCPTLVPYGAKTYPVLKHASRSLADVLPNARLQELPGQNHNVATRRHRARPRGLRGRQRGAGRRAGRSEPFASEPR